MDQGGIILFNVPEDGENRRLDHFLSAGVKSLSRSSIQGLIKRGHVLVNGHQSKPGAGLKPGDQITIYIPENTEDDLEPEPVDFSVIYEDASIIVLNKPAGVVVHPGAGHSTGTLVHGLLHYGCDLSLLGGPLRRGIVHRLDKETSGLLVVAKNDNMHANLSRQFKAGNVSKEYLALVHGRPHVHEGSIDLPIGRHPKKRTKMSVVDRGGRPSLTFWRLLETFEKPFSRIMLSLKTGRTHQIRVHMAHLGHPVVGDPIYGHGRRWWKRHTQNLKGLPADQPRQMLHAWRLGFEHPHKEIRMNFEAPVPDDMEFLIGILRDPMEAE